MRTFLTILLSCGFVLVAKEPTGGAAAMQEACAAVVQKAMPAVVTVTALRHNGSTLVPASVGSGFFISAEGHIVTNVHVIRYADAVDVKLANNRTVSAAILGESPNTDLAVLKIRGAKEMPYLRFADTRKVKVGHTAIAIGAPFALSQTVTTGIVSFKGRELGLHYKEEYIQTDASINPGNSGGPLLNLQGEVIGVNDCMLAPKTTEGRIRGSVGVGFAIDGNLARKVAMRLIKKASSKPPQLGVVMTEYNATTPAVIKKVVPGSAADKAGLLAKDRIIKVDDHKTPTIRAFFAVVKNCYGAGDRAVLTIERNGKTIKCPVIFGQVK